TTDTHSVTAVNGVAGNVNANVTGTYGTLHLNSNGTYTYALNNGLRSEERRVGKEQRTHGFHYTKNKNQEARSHETLAMTSTGHNDAPVAVADINAVTEDASESSRCLVLRRVLDGDTTDTHSVTAVNGVAGNVNANVTGTYGTLHLNSNGTYTYALNNGL